MIYTVDEVSDVLGIPRPTLYRYLREYSIPHLRRSGKISIPEDSFDRIREARELHKEGLGTESVRRKLRDGAELDPGELTERLERLSENLESLHTHKPGEETSLSREALEAIQEKQDLLISAVSDLRLRMDDLLSAGTRTRTSASEDTKKTVQEGRAAHRSERMPGARENAEQIPGTRYQEAGVNVGGVANGWATGTAAVSSAGGVAVYEPAVEVEEDDATVRIIPEPERPYVPTRREKFGALARRRRNGVVVLLLGLLAGVVLVGWSLSGGEEEAERSATGEEIEQPAVDEQAGEGEAARTVEEVEVPDLVGLTFLETEYRLAEAGLEIGELIERTSYEAPEGEVIAQEPSAGARVESGATTNLVVSAGPPGVPAGTPIGDTGVAQYPIRDASLPIVGAQYPGGVAQPEPFVPVVPAAG